MGGYANPSQSALFQEIDFVGQGCDGGRFKRSMFFTPSPLEFMELAHKGRKARFIILAVEPCLVPSLKRNLHRKIKEASTRADLKTHTPNDLTVSGTRLIFQEKVILEQGKLGGTPRKASQRWTKTAI
jgi:hypothetical protein